ncbi:isochorismatase family cysteine hydrolase [Pseudomonas syringae]|uniref:isochorismatase family cysteine hydrolase n=1 Tax=Pseudomonas syringae TaxID=317 RepID=UPI0002A79EA5|nr:isochorismatase family cysteine hydrolase [Pseudomonas syringae]ELP96394.1 isochorismatase hydrolase [Pseudomonas syringae BRIP34876]ELQ02844.1 isochorismatase hydrolase [Pseudomonas syringae BRIP34881]
MDRPVIIALHYQNDVLHPEGRIKVGLNEDGEVRNSLISSATVLLRGARKNGWPIIHVRVAYRGDYSDLIVNAPILQSVKDIGAVIDGTWGAEFLDALSPHENGKEFIVTHKRINAFYGTHAEALLNMLNARTLIIAGVATHSVVESTVRHAVDCGYHVIVPADACSSADPEVHQASLKSMSLIAEISSIEQVFKVQS